MKLYKITETISETRKAGGDFAMTINVSRRFVRRARRAARKGDRDAMYRVWKEFCDWAWPRVKERHELGDADRPLWDIDTATAIP